MYRAKATGLIKFWTVIEENFFRNTSKVDKNFVLDDVEAPESFSCGNNDCCEKQFDAIVKACLEFNGRMKDLIYEADILYDVCLCDTCLTYDVGEQVADNLLPHTALDSDCTKLVNEYQNFIDALNDCRAQSSEICSKKTGDAKCKELDSQVCKVVDAFLPLSTTLDAVLKAFRSITEED